MSLSHDLITLGFRIYGPHWDQPKMNNLAEITIFPKNLLTKTG